MSLGIFTIGSAEDLKLGLNADLILPLGDSADKYKLSFGGSATVLFPVAVFAIEGSIGYWLIQDGRDLGDFSASLIPITAGSRLELSPEFHFDFGLGYYIKNVKIGDVSESDSTLGIYGGAGFFIHPNFDIKARIHLLGLARKGFLSNQDVFLCFSAGFYFN